MLESVLDRCEAYVRSRQCPDGGFCFYRAWGVEEPSFADTYAAVRSLCLLERPIPNRDSVLGWVREAQQPDGAFPTETIAFFALETLRQLGEAPRMDPAPYLRETAERLSAWDLRSDFDWSAALRDQMRLVVSSAYQALPPTESWRDLVVANVQLLRCERGGYGKPTANLIDTHDAVATLRTFGASVDTEGVGGFLRTSEDREIGFLLVPNSTAASLSTQWAGVSLGSLLELPSAPAILDAARRTVLASQRDPGGFGRVPGAIATLQDTCLALEVLLAP